MPNSQQQIIQKTTKNATAAFLIEGPDQQQHRIFGNNRTPGRRESLSSYRTELGGIAGIIAAITSIIKFHHIKTGKVRIGLDNAMAIKQITSNNVPPLKQNQWT